MVREMIRRDFLKKTGLLFTAGTVSTRNLLSVTSKPKKILPPALKPGDTIGFISPAGILFDENLFENMQKVMESMGFKVQFGKNVKNRYGYLAGTDEERANDLNQFFSDPEINGIVTVRGGWGSNRILNLVNYNVIRENPKIFCGFSDITALHLSIYKNTGLVTFHGPNGNSDWTLFTRDHFKKLITGKNPKPLLENPGREKHNIHTIQPGTASGKLLGGNLTLITSLIGSSYLPDFTGAILFLEDVGEDVYKIDRMMSQLKLSGILKTINGFVFGKCTNCKESQPISFSLVEVFEHYLKPLGIPSFSGSMISHEPNNFTLPVGIMAQMDAAKGTIQLLEKPVT
jgi:muramoyltetrapeptide carboxypeptidase